MAESLKVAVRVRPFNQREKDRQAKLVIQMTGQMTTIQNPDQPNEAPKKFSFDYSYWSHDAFVERDDGYLEAKPGSPYASQRVVFNNLGQGVLDNAFEGYNTSLFAYGQTGSGKSYSMVGYGVNKGIVPITCDEMFKAIDANSDGNKRFEVTFSMLEIYNEQVRDLLVKDNPKGGLQVRQNPKLGIFYVDGLKRAPVGNYSEIERKMEIGTHHRTVASTNMNATSSRAHTVVTITFDQIVKGASGETKKSSTMNLVDLAGSERADSTGATGDRLKEGANINKSLSALGNVISALADLSMGKKKIMVPYRDSVLTKLLQNALGGNSKTIMIAALSPADINFDETVSTLRYADRAKKIKNKAVVNENPMDKLIRELREENEKLRKAMEAGGFMQATQGMSEEEIAKMRRKMEEDIRLQFQANQQLLQENAMTWEDKLAAERSVEAAQEVEVPHEDKRKQTTPHLTNINEDPMLSGVIFHFLNGGGDTIIGKKEGNWQPGIALSGPSITRHHCVICVSGGEVVIKPGDSSGSRVKLNGVPLAGPTPLSHKDRIVFGSNHVYVFTNPLKPTSTDENLPSIIGWEFVQKEIAQAKGFATSSAGLTKDQQIAQEQVLELLPMVSEVNAISEELNKHRSFEVVLISAAAQEGGMQKANSTKVMVKMKNLLNNNTWLWERGKFMNRRYLIQDLYQNYLDGDDDVLKVSKDKDPFWEPAEDVLVGTANVFLQSLAYALDYDDKLTVTDYKGQEEGGLVVRIAPCTQAGKPLDEDYFVEDPKNLLGKPYHFKVLIRNGEVIKARFSKGVRVKFKVFDEDTFSETKLIKGTLSPEWNYSRIVNFPALHEEHLEYFEHGCITFNLYGIQEDSVPDPKLKKMTTRELRQMERNEVPAATRRTSIMPGGSADVSSDTSHLKTELMLLARKYERLEQKEKRLQQVVAEWDKKPEEEQQFGPFFRTVSAVAHSTGTKLKTRVEMVNRLLKMQRQVEQNGSASAGKKGGASSGGKKPQGPQKEGSRACAVM